MAPYDPYTKQHEEPQYVDGCVNGCLILIWVVITLVMVALWMVAMEGP